MCATTRRARPSQERSCARLPTSASMATSIRCVPLLQTPEDQALWQRHLEGVRLGAAEPRGVYALDGRARGQAHRHDLADRIASAALGFPVLTAMVRHDRAP